MLRPQSNRFLGSSRAERRRNLRRERSRAVGDLFDTLRSIVTALAAGLIALFLLWGLPLLYAASSFLTLALPLRWLTGRAPFSIWALLEWICAIAISILGLARAALGSEPVAPVRAPFARAMLGFCWLGALFVALADVWG